MTVSQTSDFSCPAGETINTFDYDIFTTWEGKGTVEKRDKFFELIVDIFRMLVLYAWGLKTFKRTKNIQRVGRFVKAEKSERCFHAHSQWAGIWKRRSCQNISILPWYSRRQGLRGESSKTVIKDHIGKFSAGMVIAVTFRIIELLSSKVLLLFIAAQTCSSFFCAVVVFSERGEHLWALWYQIFDSVWLSNLSINWEW